MKLEYCDSTGCSRSCLCVHNTLIKSSRVTAFQAINIFCSCRNTMQLCFCDKPLTQKADPRAHGEREDAEADGGDRKQVSTSIHHLLSKGQA